MKKNFVLSHVREIYSSIAKLRLNFAILFIAIFVLPTSAAHAQTVTLNPSSINAVDNQQFTVDVMINGAVNVFGIGFDLIFDPNLLTFVSATDGGFLSQNAPAAIFSAVNPPGDLVFSQTRLGASSGGATGNGTVAHLNFRTLNQDGVSSLRFVSPSICVLSNGICSYPAATWQGSTVTISVPDTTPPTAPTNLLFGSVSASRIDLSWTASTDNRAVAGYKLYRDGSLIATVTNGTAYQNSGLSSLTSYVYKVIAFDTAGNVSTDSNIVTATTQALPDTVPPNTPTSLSAGPASDTDIDLSWNASVDPMQSGSVTSGLAGYKIYRDGTYLITTIASSYQDTGLIAGTAYSYQVSAVDQAGNESARSAAVQATTLTPPDTQAPNTPGNLRTSSITTDRIDLAWDASTDPSTGSGQASGVTGYRVYRDNIFMMTVAVTSYYNAGLSPGESHAYQVSAVDAAGNESARSTSLTVTTLLPPDTTAPSIPTGLTASVISTNQINLSWSASTDNVAVSGYIIFQNNVQVGTSDRNTYQATSLAAATGYTFKVRATDSAGNQSADSNQVIASTLDPADSQAPGIIIVLPTQNATYSTSSAHITLSGTAIDNIGVSRVNWANDRGGAGIAAGTNVWLIDDIELQAGVNNLSVTAHDAAGNSSSDSLTITYNPPDTQAPSAPILSGVAYTAWQINLTWTASTDSAVNGIAASGLAGYRLYRDNVLIATLTGRSYQNFGLTPATAYTYRVAAFDRAGNTVDSNHVTLTTASATDSLPPTAPASLRAYLANDRQVNLSWYRSTDPLDSARLASGIAGYRIYRDNRRVGFSAGTAYSDIDLATSTNFRYIVSAVDNAGNESFSSNTVQISTQTGLEKIRPSGPRYLRTNIISHNKARFDWPAATDNVGVTGYMIFRNGLHIASVNGTAFEEAGLAPLTVYSYRVSAFDAAGNNSYQSSALNLRTQATPDTTAPTQPANFRNVYNSYYPWTVRLYWNSSTDDRPGLRYYIYRNNQLIAESRYGAFSENLKEPGYYIYQVSAVDWAGNESARTNTIVQPYVRDDIAPTLPRNLRSVYNAYYPNQVRLYWDRSVDDRYGAIKYRVYKNGSVLTVTNGTSFAENLTVYGTNYYEVQAYDPAGNETGRSNQVSVSYAADTVAPSVPAGLRAFQDTRTTNLMKIYWNRSLDDRAGNIVYNVYRDGVKLGATRNTSYYDRLATRGTYIYSISAQDQANNESDLSATVTMVY